MKPVTKVNVAVAAVAACVAVVVLAGMVFDNPVKSFFKQQQVMHSAKMHMSQVKNGVYGGSLRFSDDIDFNNLALSQMIPVYGIRQNGEFFRYEHAMYAVYSNGSVVALFGVYEDEVYGGTSMSNAGLDTVQDMLADSGTCACVRSYDLDADVFVRLGSEEAVVVYGPDGPTDPGAEPRALPTPETVSAKDIGLTTDMIAQIDFPRHQDPVPFSV